mmetsp:Transcript_2157/g.3176  ORF Transcript_2157/g.3176 Transcript_2157/m.3176 type:complete len:226 (-) Transcript_2157:337-1014(-)
MAKQALTALESEFLAEDNLVTIIPSQAFRELKFVQGHYGPLKAGVPIKVPLWLAITLKKRGKCNLKPPTFMNPDYLRSKLAKEKQSTDTFSDLPFNYMEIASLLLSSAADDIEHADTIRTLLEDIENVRMSKIRLGMNDNATQVMSGEMTQSVKMNNIGSMELVLIRNFFTEALHKFYVISGRQAQAETQQPAGASAAAAGAAAGAGAADTTAGMQSARKLRRFR